MIRRLFAAAVLFSSLASPALAGGKAVREVAIAVTDRGFEPARVAVKKGERLKLVVTRKVEQTCATAISIPDYGVRKELPLGKPVAIVFTPKKSGEVKYTCGMGMVGGVIAVE